MTGGIIARFATLNKARAQCAGLLFGGHMEEHEYTIVINVNLENAFGDFFLKVERGMKCLK